MSSHKEPPESDRKAADRMTALVAAAERLGYAKGLAGITTRSLARAAGRSLSSVGYHFGGQEGVLIALYHKLAHDTSLWRTERLQNLRVAQLDFLQPAAAAGHALADLTGRYRSRTLLTQEIEDWALRGSFDLVQTIAEEYRAMGQFWRDVMGVFGIDGAQADVFTTVMRGTIPTLLAEPDPVVCGAYITGFMQRLFERLSGRTPGCSVQQTKIEVAASDSASAPRGKRLIIEAALRLIGEKGVPQVTHRDIAAAAGLSVAATTYFFKNKSEIIFAAFQELLQRISAAHTAPAPDSGAFTGALLTASGEIGWESNAIRSWYLAAARDPELLPSVRLVQTNYWGIAVAPLLRAFDVTEVDRHDGMLATFLANGAITDSRLLQKHERKAFLENQMECGVALLFAAPS